MASNTDEAGREVVVMDSGDIMPGTETFGPANYVDIRIGPMEIRLTEGCMEVEGTGARVGGKKLPEFSRCTIVLEPGQLPRVSFEYPVYEGWPQREAG